MAFSNSFIIILFSLTFFGIKEKFLINQPKVVEVIKTEKSDNQQLSYKSVKIGSSNLFIEVPYEITPSKVNFPQVELEKMIRSEAFYFEKDKTFQGKIAYMIWKDNINYSIEKGVNGAIENVKRLVGVEKVTENREYFTKGKLQGCIITATVYRYGKSFKVKGAFLSLERESWTIIINLLNSKDENIANRIINSLK